MSRGISPIDLRRGRTIVGRIGERSALIEAFTDLEDEHCRVVHVLGEPGIGKTALLADVLSELDVHLVSTSADPLSAAQPYGVLLAGLAGDTLMLNGHSADDGELTGGDQMVAGAILEEFRERLEAGPVALVVDNLHWADPGTLRLIPRLVDQFRSMPLVVVTAGHPQLMRGDWWLMAGLARVVPTHEIRLGGLSPAESALVAETLLGRPPERREQRALAGAAGNPLLLGMVARALTDRSRPRHDLDGPWTPIDALSLPVAEIPHLSVLSPDCLRFLTLVSMLPEGFDAQQMEFVTGLTTHSLVPLVQEATSWGLLQEDQEGQLRFHHSALRATLQSDLPAVVRSALHRRVARQLDEAGAAVSLVADHLRDVTLTPGDAEWVQSVAVRCTPTAPESALPLWHRLLQHGENDPTDPQRAEVETNLALCHFSLGNVLHAEAIARRVLDRGRVTTQVSALRTCVEQALMLQGRWEDARTVAEISVVADQLFPWERAEQEALGSVAALLGGDRAGAVEAARIATEAASASGSVRAMIWVLLTRGHLAHLQGQLLDAEILLREASRLSVEDGSRTAIEACAHASLGMVLADLDRISEANAALGQARRLARDTGSITAERVAQMIQTWVDFHHEPLDKVGHALDTQLARDDEVVRLWTPRQIGRRALVAFHVEGPDAATGWLNRLEPQAIEEIGYGMAWPTRASVAVRHARGDTRGALSELKAAWAVAADAEMLMDLPVLAVDLAEAAAAAGDRDAARSVTDCLQSLADSNPDVVSLRVAALTCRGIAEGDPSMLSEAADSALRSPRRIPAAQAAEHAALAVARTGARSAAEALGRQALAGYAAAGARFEVARARRGFRNAGISIRSPEKSRPGSGWESLTPAERAVARLIEQGLSNTEIAEQRVVSRRTVETHVSHVLAKLGLKSRSDLILHAARRGRIPIQRGSA